MLRDTINIWTPDPPSSEGWEDEIKECSLCDGKGFDESISECCGDDREPDLCLCYECHDHCDPCICPDCNGTGIIN